MWGEFAAQKTRSRMPYNRPLGHRHTFCIKPDFGEIDFFTSSRPQVSRPYPGFYGMLRNLTGDDLVVPTLLIFFMARITLRGKNA
jgi:hypothetical protein